MRKKFWLLPLILGTILSGILASLGVWQLGRMEWKNAQLETIQRGIEQQPVPLPPDQSRVRRVQRHEIRRVAHCQPRANPHRLPAARQGSALPGDTTATDSTDVPPGPRDAAAPANP